MNIYKRFPSNINKKKETPTGISIMVFCDPYILAPYFLAIFLMSWFSKVILSTSGTVA